LGSYWAVDGWACVAGWLVSMIASCPTMVNTKDRYNARTHAKRNKHVTFVEPLETSPKNTSTQVKQLNNPKTNVPVIPSTRVKNFTKASRSQPRSNTKIDRTLTAKSGHKKNVEAHLRNNKFDLHKKNRVDSGISFKRDVVNSNSNSHYKTCNKCMISFNHDECVVKFLKSSNKSPVKKIWKAKQVKQTWQPTGTVFTKVGYQWKPTGRTFTLGEHCSLTRNSKPNVVPIKQWKPTGRIIPLGCQCPLIRPHASTSGRIVAKSQTYHVPVAHNAPFLKEKKGVRFSALFLKKEKSSYLRAVLSTTFISSHDRSVNNSGPTPNFLTHGYISSGLVQNSVSPTPYVPPSKKDYEILFQQLFYEYLNPPPRAVSPVSTAVAAPRVVDPAGSPSSTIIDQDVPSASTSPTTQKIQSQVTHQDPSSEETTLQGFIPSNLHHLNQSFDTLTKLTMNHPLENVICDPSRSGLIRSQLQGHAIWCYVDANDNPIPLVENDVIEIYYLKGRIIV
nr:hypothetical protein [Tanacetum cinerariifolium]